MAISFQQFIESPKSKQPHILIVGYPLGHTLSPLMHNIALQHHGIEAEYLAVELYPNEVTKFVSLCSSDAFLGCNITLPYKQEFFPLADSVDQDASDIGALNVLTRERGQLVGYNTDIHGFLEPLLKYADEIEGCRAIVFGTGGSSKAVCSGLFKMGAAEIIQVTRSPEGKESGQFPEATNYVDYSQWTAYADEATLIVNCTPLGMSPNLSASPVREGEAEYLHGKICYDLVYNPVNTSFLRLSESVGAKTIGGLEMLIQQGNRAFELWTGKRFPLDLIRQAIEENFLSRQ